MSVRMTLKAARVNKGMTQKEAAKSLRISNKTLCSWENGDTMPNTKKVPEICKLYGVSYDNLVFLPDNPL